VRVYSFDISCVTISFSSSRNIPLGVLADIVDHVEIITLARQLIFESVRIVNASTVPIVQPSLVLRHLNVKDYHNRITAGYYEGSELCLNSRF
jgi:hypothetical protein